MRLGKKWFMFSAKHCVLWFLSRVFCHNLYEQAMLSSDMVFHAKIFLIKTSRGLF